MSSKPNPARIQYPPVLPYQFETDEAYLRVIIATAEESTLLELTGKLHNEADTEIIADAVDGFDAVEKIMRLRPNLVFLDVDLPGLNGFDVISNLDYCPAVVFISALHHHAIRAFETNALDFLPKPICTDRVEMTLSRARAALAVNREMTPLAYTPISRDPVKSGLSVPRLAVHKGKRVLLLSLKEIFYIKVENKLVFSFTADNNYLINRTITELDELLKGEGFFQINRATIINLEHLLEIIPWFSGTCRLKLATGMELPLSRTRTAALKAKVGLSKRWSGK